MSFKSASEEKGTRTCYVHRAGLCHLGGTRGQMERMERVLEGREDVCSRTFLAGIVTDDQDKGQ